MIDLFGRKTRQRLEELEAQTAELRGRIDGLQMALVLAVAMLEAIKRDAALDAIKKQLGDRVEAKPQFLPEKFWPIYNNGFSFSLLSTARTIDRVKETIPDEWAKLT